MTTALQLITGAAKLIRVVRKGESMPADDAMDGLNALNDMLDSWSTESLLVMARTWESFNLSPAASYSIGAGQTLNTVRPTIIKSAFIRVGTTDYPLTIVTDEEYESIADKSTPSPFPAYINIDNAYPYGTIRLFPQLGSSAQFHLLSEKPVTNIATLNTVINFAPGWKRALRFNLALELSGEYGVDPKPSVIKGAAESLNLISLGVAKMRPIKYRPSAPQTRNIYTGYY